jgi:hypothetical protein
MIARLAALAGVLVARTAMASPDSPEPTEPLATIKDDKQLSEALTQITQDPAIPVDDPQKRTLAQALMIEGVKQLQAKAYDQALANFLEAYGKFPSPKILLNIASTLRDMGRAADAANTYQRYLTDPQTGAERVAEVKDLLLKLDEQLTILTIRVAPRLSAISIDAGSFIPVGSTLVTRVRPGLHLIRVKNGDKSSEVTVNGFEGENKEVLASIQMDVTDPPVVKDPPKPKDPVLEPKAPPEHQEGWLITGQYKSEGGTNQRTVLTTTAGSEVRATMPVFEVFEGDPSPLRPKGESITSGLLGVLRIDAEGRGFAGGLGLAISRGRFEGDIMVLRSNQTGGYLGFRYRFLTGFVRPYAAVGIPGFVFDNTTQVDGMDVTETKLAIGARVAGGVELYINGHLSVQADFGFEHFWFVDNTPFVANVYVPTVGVIGRL